jgi:hypothetical protein
MAHHQDHTSAASSDADHGHALGVHGMLVFGGERTSSLLSRPVYVSHLPMFMAPHDFQVIARVTGEAAARYDAFVAHFGFSVIYTFRPEPFSIDELDPARGGQARTSFGGTLFRGHFERGGGEIASDVSFGIEQVVHFRRFSTAAANTARGQLHYLCFGERDAAFLAHLITAPPDFDQILFADIGSLSGVPDEDLRAGVIVTVPDRPDDVKARLQEGEAFSGALQVEGTGAPRSIELTVAHEYYLETGDLAAAM